ncbi:hypothetical protein D7I39_11300 [Allopusillimonas ginsengisoli]|nr:hypothetical protein D7I39_11300 [Allopusillimonas ginsengisoli]
MPAVDRADLINEAQSILSLIIDREGEFDPEDADMLETVDDRLDFLLRHTIPQLASQPPSIPTYLLTLQYVRQRLLRALPPPDTEDLSKQITRAKKRARSMEARLNDIEPRAEHLESMLKRIEDANEAADQLPADLESLIEARQIITTVADKASADGATITATLASIKEQEVNLLRIDRSATAILERCETAYASSTSVGLAAAFSERSKSLNSSIYFWVGGLVISLITGGIFGSIQLHKISSIVADPNASAWHLVFNLFLSVFSVGAPIWFAWLATKQIGQRFKLSEDYAFKASISRAYEGYRREAARIDDATEGSNMEAQLLQSALTRLDELPLRLVEVPTHGSPWSEMLASDAVREAVKTIPGFAHQVRGFAEDSIAKYRGGKKTGPVNSRCPRTQPSISTRLKRKRPLNFSMDFYRRTEPAPQ